MEHEKVGRLLGVFAFLAIIGLLTMAISIFYGLLWLYNHVHFY